jgi:hypothetical protein
MTKRITILLVAVLLMAFVSGAFAGDLAKFKVMPKKQKLIRGDEPLPDAPFYPSYPGLLTASPGDTVGYTQYDYQTNGSTGNRIVVDHTSNIHVSWMKGMPYPSVRHIYYNCKTPSGWIYPLSGTQASHAAGAGYTTIDALPDDRATVFYHRAPTNAESTFVAIDIANCLATFDYRRPPSRQGSQGFIWPSGAVDRTGRIHVVATNNAATGAAQAVIYTRSNNGGTTWVALQRVDTTEVISTIVTASRASDKVAIVYTHSTDTTSQWANDVYFIQSLDGTTWDWAGGKINVTEYGQGGDSLFAYTDVDAVYDYNDNLHIIWNAQYVTTGIYYSSQLLHFDVASGNINQIAQFDSLWPSSGCEFGVWNWSYAKMSIGCDTRNNLYATYTSWDTSDCSSCGYANGDIYMNYSVDGGSVWSEQYNLTNSHTPNCDPGDCDSDHWSSLAEVVDTALHLFYVNDKDAGGIPQTECSVTENPMLYYSYSAVPPLLGIEEGDLTPKSFTLAQNYPNPFNARTNIDFELTRGGHVLLSVFDITGAKVATLVNGNFEAGKHQVNWDAENLSSGVYYYTLKANGSDMTRKMTLLK